MKLRVIILILVVMILIISVPALANEEIPEPSTNETYSYWVIIRNLDDVIYLIRTREPVTVTTDGRKIIIKEGPSYPYGYYRYIIEDGQWKYDGGITNPNYFPLEKTFNEILNSNHDIAYEDGSGFFFRAELPEPDDENDGFWENLEEFFSWFNPDSWFNGIVSSVQESVGLLTEPIERIINFLNPLHEDFFLRVAFIPSTDYVEVFREEIKAIFDNKLSFINEIRDFLAFIFSTPILDNPGPPEFKITLPGGKWGSGSVQIIDFSIFEDYRLFIINFIRVLLWIPFLIKLYKRLPSIVY